MNNIVSNPLSATLPYAIAKNKKAKCIAAAIDVQLSIIGEDVALILLLPNLDKLSEPVLDSLAWQYHVDFYDYNADVEQKRALIRYAVAWHRIKGTPAAVEELCKTVFKNAEVREWFDYGGKPYHFQVRMIEEAVPNTEVLESLLRAIEQTKNTRSWCDCISFHREIKGNLHLGIAGYIRKKIEIRPLAFVASDIEQTIFYGGAIAVGRYIEIKPNALKK